MSKKQFSIITGNYDTSNEIMAQPEIWRELFKSYLSRKKDLETYLKEIYNNKEIKIILTGAGTSAFIGEVLSGIFNKVFDNTTHAVATTDLVTHPELYFKKDNKYLIISFARSGSSPESSQIILLSEMLSAEVYHLIITCSSKSNLLEIVTTNTKRNYTWIMPAESNDKGLAMTSSFTTMLLAGLLLTKVNDSKDQSEQIDLLIRYAEKILNKYAEPLKGIAAKNFNRAVFLGSGILKGIAKESHLKLQELTDGKVICKYDSFMGFRHGPKAVIDENTLVTYLFSNKNYSNFYETDLVNAISSGRRYMAAVAVMEEEIGLPDMDLKIILSDDGKRLDEEFLSIVTVLPAQLLGFFKSLEIGLNPDSPSSSGMIHRVVQGVKIYPYNNGN